MAMKDESQLPLQTPAKDPTSLKSHYDPVTNITNGLPDTHNEDDSRPRRNNAGHVTTCREEGREEGGVVNSVEEEEKEEESREETKIEGPTTRFVKTLSLSD